MIGGDPQALVRCATPSPVLLADLCSQPQRPDFLVFESPVQATPLSVLTAGPRRFSLYACTQFQRAAP